MTSRAATTATVGVRAAKTVAVADFAGTSRMVVVPLLVVATTYGLVGPNPVLAVALACAVLVGVFLPARARLGVIAQVLFAALLFAMAVTLITMAFVVPEPVPLGTLRRGWSAMAFALLVAAVSRLYVHRPAGGDAVTLAIALFSMAACGGTISGPIYPAAVALFLLTAAVARRSADDGRAAWRRLSPRWAIGAAVGAGSALIFALGSTVVLPQAHGWMVRQIMHAATPSTGFTTRIWLGSLGGLLLSDKVVLRLRGQRANYLRGHVYTTYQNGRWSGGARDFMVVKGVPIELAPAERARQTEVEFATDDPERYFLPLGAAKVAVPTGRASVHRTGIVAPLAADPVDRYWYHSDGPRVHPVAPPTDEDLYIPRSLARRLESIAQRFTATAGEDGAAQLRAIEHRLQTEYRYSLQFERSAEHDPIVSFLADERTGHCEYFASAMVMLSRARGIPARLIGGYVVTERSELGDYYIVRERNAHTWVEAWVEGQGWRTFDPTPAAELARTMPTTTPWLSSVGDLLRTGWAAWLRWLDQRTPLEALITLVAVVFSAIVARWLGARRRRRGGAARWQAEPPLECFVQLAEVLARQGLERAPHEPIEHLARRVRGSGLPAEQRDRAADLLARYAAFRYGGEGDPAALDAEVAQFVGRLVPAS